MGEGGPLAVDEELKVNKHFYLDIFDRQTITPHPSPNGDTFSRWRRLLKCSFVARICCLCEIARVQTGGYGIRPYDLGVRFVR